MAKVKFGMMMTDASGKLGGQVFSKNKAGSYVRTKVTPANPQTSYQSGVRALFGGLSAQWGTLTDAQRASWINAVDDFKKTNVFGDLKAPTGKALFQRLNNNLLQSGQTVINEAPQVEAPASLTNVVASYSAVDSMLTLEADGDATGSQIQIWATPPLSPGTTFFKNRVRVIDYAVGAASTSINITELYTDRFGAISANDNIYVGLRTISATGQASVLSVVKVAFVA